MSSLLAADLMPPGPGTLSDLVPAMGQALTGGGPAGLGLPDATRYVFLYRYRRGPRMPWRCWLHLPRTLWSRHERLELGQWG